MKAEREELPTGKVVIRFLNDAEELIEEMHAYGSLDISHSAKFQNGKKFDETYIVNKRIVRRARYEKVRLQYSDMPPADLNLEDGWNPVLTAINRERRQHSKELEIHKPNPEKARELDQFCVGLMKEGECVATIELLKREKNALGELSHAASKRLISKLTTLGSKNIHACKIERYEDGMINTGHLVIELPEETAVRKKLLIALHKLAEKEGYTGDLDDGQRFAYVKLD